MHLVYRPKHAMNLHCVLNGECPQTAVTGQKDASWLTFRESKRESVVYRKCGNAPHDFLSAQNSFARQINNLQSGANECLLLSQGELEQLFLEKRIRNQKLVRKPKEGFEQ